MTHAIVIIGRDDFAVIRGLTEQEAIDAARLRSRLFPTEAVSAVSLISGETIKSFAPKQITLANLGDRAAHQ